MKLKKILAGTLACCVIGGCLPYYGGLADNSVITVSAAEDYTTGKYESLRYNNYGDHIEIYGCDESATSVVIPAKIDDVPVTSILGDTYVGAFKDCTKLTEITIPDSVTSIGYRAFENTPWLKAKQEENPLVIVNKILIDGTTCSGDVIIPNGVTSIGDEAFDQCSGLTSITIPDSVTIIGEEAFACCTGLTEITIPDSVANIGGWAFLQTPWLESKKAENPLVIINGVLIDGTTCSGKVIIPDNVTSISDAAFSGSGLKTITVPNSVTSIGEWAFCYSDLRAIIIPDSLTSISIGTFKDCSSLKEVTIPDSVTSIGDRAFESCSSLTEITIPNSVTSIGDSTFRYCSKLTQITIPDSVTSIGNSAFSYCKGLTEVIIPDSVTSIDYIAFKNCTELKEITILNPDCEICDDDDTITNDYDSDKSYFNGTIYGYENSTAQAYAEKYGRKFVALDKADITTSPATDKSLAGDANEDGEVTVADAAAILQYLGNNEAFSLTAQGKKNGDVDGSEGLTPTDALAIQKHCAGLLDKFPL